MFTATVFAEPIDEFVRLLTKFSNTPKLQTQFTQQTNNTQSEIQRGVFYFVSPDQFKWEYTYPYEMSIFSYDNALYIYDKVLGHLTIKNINEENLGPTSILTQKSVSQKKLQSLFSKITYHKDNQGHAQFTLIPASSETLFESLLVTFNLNEFPKQIAWKDSIGGEHAINFISIVTNKMLPKDLFLPPHTKNLELYDMR
ncbi:MAG: outer-membrane lipoprotein carrier protein LolA [Methylacidiphilales bacterium]|nr:outer-membrane lipoprotein carrier protein LolA [Candidatus Methylacidiphilales bacterium]